MAFDRRTRPGRERQSDRHRSLQQAECARTPSADYVVPGASVGYMPGYGEAFQTTPDQRRTAIRSSSR